MADITTEYRGFTITYDEYAETWRTEISEGKYQERDKLGDVKKKIDDFLKAESEFKNLDAISLQARWGHKDECGTRVVISSVAENGDVWIKRDGKREKVFKSSRDQLCKATPENEARVTQIRELNAQKEAILEEVAAVKSAMERVFRPDE